MQGKLWNEKKRTTSKFIIKIDKELAKPYISKEKEPNNSNEFNMTDLTPFKKDGMNPPDWKSVDK